MHVTIDLDLTRDQAEALDRYFGREGNHADSLATLLGNFAADLAEGQKEADERVRISQAAMRAKDARAKLAADKPVNKTPAS